jgi:protein O-mannosyl-transferase
VTERKKVTTVLLVVIGITALVHLRSLFQGFNYFWDLIHVFQNPFQSTFSFDLLSRIFTDIVEAEYTPIRLLSNSFDYTFWQLNPFGHHLTSYLFFLINVALLFLVLLKLLEEAGCQFRERIAIAGLTAILFGLHPSKVEVVTWITPREYIICACFYLLSLFLYIKWVGSSSIKWYLLAVLCAVGAALSQPLSVSLPLVLLILDYYPLRRFRGRQWRWVLVEKIPFFLIAVLTIAKIIQIRRQVGIIHPAGFSSMLSNLFEFPAVMGFYISKTIYPMVLLPIYPIDLTNNLSLIIISGIIIIGVIVFAVIKKRKNPALFVGVLIFIATILPYGGVVRSGATVLADRYLYIVIIPLLLGLVWAIVRGWNSRYFRWPVALLTIIWMVFLIWKTITYTGMWDQDIGLTRQAYDRYPGSKIIEIFMLRTYTNAAMRKVKEKKFDEAFEYVHQALKIKPDYIDAYLVLAHALSRQGKEEKAHQVYQKALEIKQESINTYLNLGVFHGNRGELGKAEAMFKTALEYGGDSAEAHYNLGLLYKRQGKLSDAVRELESALDINSFSPQIYFNLAEVLELQGKNEEAALIRKGSPSR